MYPMGNRNQEQPKKEVRKLSNKIITITLIWAIIRRIPSWPRCTLKDLSRMRRGKAQARVRGAMAEAQSISIIRKWMGQKATEIKQMSQGWRTLVLLYRPHRTPITLARELAPSTPTLVARLQEAQSIIFTNRTLCKTCKTPNHLRAFEIKFKCTK